MLCVADHHELLADVSTAVHRDEKLSHVFLYRVDLFGEEHRWLCFERKRERVGGSQREKKEKGHDMYNNLQKSTEHYAIKEWYTLLFWLCISKLQLDIFPLASIEVVVLWCAYSYSKITLHHSFWLDATRGTLQRDPSGSFSYCLVCRRQLHMQASQSESAGSFTHRLLHTQRGQPDHPSYYSFFLLLAPLHDSERSLWLRESLRASESIIYQSAELTGITETINVGAIFHRRTGTNKNTNRVDWAEARPRSSYDYVPHHPHPLPLSHSLFEWMNDVNFKTRVAVLVPQELADCWSVKKQTDLGVWFNTERKKKKGITTWDDSPGWSHRRETISRTTGGQTFLFPHVTLS